jgi:hypothetical protein
MILAELRTKMRGSGKSYHQYIQPNNEMKIYRRPLSRQDMPSLCSGRSADRGVFEGTDRLLKVPPAKGLEYTADLWSVKALYQIKIIHSLEVSTYKDLYNKSSLTVMRKHSFSSAARLHYGVRQGQ